MQCVGGKKVEILLIVWYIMYTDNVWMLLNFLLNTSPRPIIGRANNIIVLSAFLSRFIIIYTNISLVTRPTLEILETVAQLYECIRSLNVICAGETARRIRRAQTYPLFDLIMRRVLLREIKSVRHDKSDKRAEFHYFRMVLRMGRNKSFAAQRHTNWNKINVSEKYSDMTIRIFGIII